MGSILSKPKAPPPPPRRKPIYVPPPPKPEPIPEPEEVIVETPEESTAIDEKQEEVKSYIDDRRRKGRLSTIKTSSRGVFDLSDLSPQRKSLLGE